MTELADAPETIREGSAAVSRGARIAAVTTMIIALLATAGARYWAIEKRTAISRNGQISTVDASSTLDSMPSYATALMLGGLRGPLVMILWTSTETQKREHQLQDLDTKIEWIRLLQPEFDTVHIFQIWNKAYNISVQMASLSNKYAAIVDALDYAKKVDRQTPDDINILVSIGQIWGEKLGESAEKDYYTRHVRRDTLTLMRFSFPSSRVDEFRSVATPLGWTEDDSPLTENAKGCHVLLEKYLLDRIQTKFNGSDTTAQPEMTAANSNSHLAIHGLHVEPICDPDGNLFPQYLQPRFDRPADVPADQPYYDGSDLQFLKEYQPFPYGVPTYALAYNYYRRSQLLMRQWDEHHIQQGDSAIDNRPGVALELWAKDEWARALRLESLSYGRSAPNGVDQYQLEPLTATVPIDQPVTNAYARQDALAAFELAARLWGQSGASIRENMQTFPSNVMEMQSHVDDAIGGRFMMLADAAFLRACNAQGQERQNLINEAGNFYAQCAQHYTLTILKYYIDERVATQVFPIDPSSGQRYTRLNIASVDPALVLPTLKAAQDFSHLHFRDSTGRYRPELDMGSDTRDEYLSYIDRCTQRMMVLQRAVSATPSSRP